MRGPFDPPTGRQTSVIVVKEYGEGKHSLITSISSRSSTEVLDVDPTTGRLTFSDKTEAFFSNEGEALKHLTAAGYDIVARGAALLGYAVVGSTAGILLATRLKSKATLPGGHVVHLVQESQWVLVTLDPPSTITSPPPPPGAPPPEQEYWKSLLQHPVQGSHFFCETVDLTSPFPSPRRVVEPVLEYAWNTWLSQPLRDLGLHLHCPVLLQGTIESADQTHPTGQRYTIALISRRSRRHPGTRYLARGLNDLAGPGNEMEADLIMWTPRAGEMAEGRAAHAPAVKWARVSWRRGTVPIWWGVDFGRGNMLQAEVYIKEAAPYEGMLTYFRNVQAQYEGEVEGPEVPVNCINLLHCNPKKAAELTLQTHFQQGMHHIKKLAPTAPIRLHNFDWHGIMGMLTEERGIEAFWTFIEPHLKAVGLATGEMQPAGTSGSASSVQHAASSSHVPPVIDVTPWGNDWQMAWHRKQHGVLRFNCADSLDRTNAATCFAMLPALQEGLRLLGVQLDITTQAAAQTLAPLGTGLRGAGSSSQLAQAEHQAGNGSHGAASASGSDRTLPAGWEKRLHGDRYLYIDHANKRTQWNPPGDEAAPSNAFPHAASAPELSSSHAASVSALAAATPPHNRPSTSSNGSDEPQAWGFFAYNLHDVRARLYRDVVEDYVDMFRRDGDVHASLYTGSSAMHSHVLGLVLPAAARTYGSGGVGKLQNLRVAVQRRWNNTMSDASRQQAMELFLGLNLEVHCPGAVTLYPPTADLVNATREGPAIPGEVTQHKEVEGIAFSAHEDPSVEGIERAEDVVPLDTDATAELPGLGAEAAYSSDDEEVDAFDPLGAVKTSAGKQHSSGPDLLGLDDDTGGAEQPPPRKLEASFKDLLL